MVRLIRSGASDSAMRRTNSFVTFSSAAAETPESHDVHETIAALQEEMVQAAEALEFERATRAG